MPTVQEVRNYWQEHPLHSFELSEPVYPRFFEDIDRIKRTDIERFSLKFWEFDRFKDKKVLDVGCGPGWFTVQYAKAGARVTAVDLTLRAVELTSSHLNYRNLSADVREANAEDLPFPDEEFDMVFSAGVLHHTPDTPQAVAECFRVLKPGGISKIALYHQGILHNRLLFPVTRMVMKLGKVKHPGADLAREAKDLNDFIRQYDGISNPVGIAKTTAEWSELLQKVGFQIEKYELHYFPKRFILFHSIIPDFIHRLCDNWFGTLIYFQLTKPVCKAL